MTEILRPICPGGVLWRRIMFLLAFVVGVSPTIGVGDALSADAGAPYVAGDAPACCSRAGVQRFEPPALAPLAATPGVGWIFDTAPYPPRWYCGSWTPAIGWLHIVSDITIWIAYLAIPCALLWFAYRLKRLPFKPLFLLFSAFILCCGFTHLMEAVIFWWPAYGLAGVLKATTAIVSVATVGALAPMIPRIMALRSPEQLEAEVKLRTEEAETARREANLLVEASPAGVVVVDPRGKIVRVNAVTEQLFGYSRHEMIGRPIELLLPERYADAHVARVAAYMHAPEPRQMGRGRDVFARHADGREFPVEIGLNLIESQGEQHVLAAVVDVSERQRLREQVEESADRITRANESLRHSNEELEQFAFIASHDLQEPLRKIAAFCQLVREEQGEQLGEDGRQNLDIAIRGAERLSTLVRDLLAFSRITTRGKPLQETDANECLQAALSDLELQAQESAAVITYDELSNVVAEPSQLRALFQNLIGNALKYRGDATPQIHVGSHREGANEVFSISDNGIGIEPQHHERIFGIFQRLHNRREYSGTGIGLAHCKKIVERFGGRIWVESEFGAGATFYFSVPTTNLTELSDASDSRTLVETAH